MDQEPTPELERRERQIASVVVISNDGKFLLGKKRTGRNSSFEDDWHIFGGGVEPGERLEDCAIREAGEEAGLLLTREQLQKIENIPKELSGAERIKTHDDGSQYIDKMVFNRFEVRLAQNATEVNLPDETLEFIEFRWFTPEELKFVQQIPGGKEFFEYMGYVQP